MDKRYQVFISSTFVDLQEERQAVLRTVLELEHMPAGMELFPATDESAWELIKDVINQSDYYVLIVGGRYGSVDELGMSYTEKEYRHAVATKKPVIAMLHEAPESLPRNRTEEDIALWQKLDAFREQVMATHTCQFWSNLEQLKSKLMMSLVQTVRRNPKIGWVRADRVPSGAEAKNMLLLKQRIEELESQLAQVRTAAPPGTENLQSGSDRLGVGYDATIVVDSEYISVTDQAEPSWDLLFTLVSPRLVPEGKDLILRRELGEMLKAIATKHCKDKHQGGVHSLSVLGSAHLVDTCIIQFRALGMIVESPKKRSLRDRTVYWSLTPYGDSKMVSLCARKK